MTGLKVRKTAVRALLLFLLALLLLSWGVAWGAVSFGPQGGMLHRSKDVSPPSAVIDDEGRVFLSWIEEEKGVNSVYLAVSTDSGATFSPEVKVNGPDDGPASIHESPSLALGPGGRVYVVWAARDGSGEFASALRFSRSSDYGRTFSPSVRVNDNKTPASAGFESMAVGPDGTVYVAWLDGRDKDKLGTSVYTAVSGDEGRSFNANVAVDSNACPCCRTAVAPGPDGGVYVAWRKVYENNTREIVFSRSTDKGASFGPPVMPGADRWQIAGCPHRGPTIKSDDKGGVSIAWYAETDDEPNVFIALSVDSGKTFVKERIEHRKGAFPDNITLNLRGTELLLAWQEVTPVLSDVIFESREGGKGARLKLNTDTRKAANPVVSVNNRGGVVVAWLKHEIRSARTVVVVGK